jgi:hypothetical protein
MAMWIVLHAQQEGTTVEQIREHATSLENLAKALRRGIELLEEER